MTLDMRTLYATIVLAYAIFGLLQLSMWRVRGSERALLLWGASNLSCALGGFLLGLRDLAPDWLTLILSNGLTLAGYGLMWAGLRQFAGQAQRWSIVVLAPTVLMGLYAGYPPVGDDLAVRIYVFATVIAAFCLICFRDAVAAQKLEPLKMRRVAMATFLATAFFMLLRIVLTFNDPEARGNFMGPSSLQSLVTLVLLSIVLLWNLSIILMASERLENRLLGMAHSDALTAVLNRAGFDTLARRLLRRCQRDHRPASVLMMDLDHFKTVNDRYGHEAGDHLLRAFIDAVRPAIRAGDLASRYGGDEFCILLPGADLDEAQTIAERIRERFERVRLAHDAREVAATVSIGVAEVEGPAETLDSVIGRADVALYTAKRTGRNRVCAAAPRPRVAPAEVPARTLSA